MMNSNISKHATNALRLNGLIGRLSLLALEDAAKFAAFLTQLEGRVDWYTRQAGLDGARHAGLDGLRNATNEEK